ncbi:hypothetical protein BKP45_09150 [Anaerobacillus alkalidiazotrophicus]|uniref:Cytochrome c-type biogenesis protein n=1 Tax=Anaerobacillus alkalidiazotrophicus TaxID=472963 RepID=A0A1S2M9Q2_9BACI|nr:cytochrome c-type biogenesis protein CcmH [Anaerobacillus alkalidiazotrophicus]OIJ20405.1 hypothetical protein BKP45_09150 [Anaerobacillus alkalidiazotrophicus]
MKTILKTILLLIIFLSSNIVGIASGELFNINSSEVKEIAGKFSMQGHENHDLATCATKQRYYEDIAELLNEGKTEQEILDYYYSMYGEEGLIVPEKSGFSLTAWITPFFVLGVASFALFIGFKKIIINQKLARSEKTKEEDVEDEIVKSIIDEERKKYY